MEVFGKAYFQGTNLTTALLRTTAIFWIIAKIISWKVWIIERSFPVVPAFGFLQPIPGWLHILFYIISLVSLFILIFKPSGYFIILCFTSEVFSCVLDQNRWQPWEYQYILILLILIINRKRINAITPMILFMLCCIYFYSGLSKLNHEFITNVWDRTILINFFKVSGHIAESVFIRRLGYLIPMIELLSGVLLVFKKTKKVSAIILIASHIWNILLLGPLGLNYNIIVWPWNAVMILYLWILVILQPNYRFNLFLLAPLNWIIILCCCVLPSLNYINLWDDYLSFSLYSGRSKYFYSYINKNLGDYPPELKPYLQNQKVPQFCDSVKTLDILKWSLAELKVPYYPEERIFKKISIDLQTQYRGLGFIFYYFESNKIIRLQNKN